MDDDDARAESVNPDGKYTGDISRKSTFETDSSSPFAGPRRFDEDMDYKELRKLEIIFRETNGGKGLNMIQFRDAMKKSLGYEIDNNELDVIFMKIDTNCDGNVDWDEYLSFMLLEYQEKENMVAIYGTIPFPHPLMRKPSNHLEPICSISFQQNHSVRYDGRMELDVESSRYVTLSKDGILNVWNTDWVLQKTTLLDGMRSNPRSVWLTDLVCMSNCNIVAIASTDYEISFYSMTSSMFQKKFQIRNMDYCALTLAYHFDFGLNTSILLWGDTNGNVVVVRFYDNPSMVLFSNTLVSDKRISLNYLLRTNIHNLKVARFQKLLPEWVKELHYYASDKEQECFIACCRNHTSSMVFADITEKVVDSTHGKIEMRRKSSFKLRTGVSCIAYDPDWNLLVTGSSDYHIRIWNPYVVTAPTMTLKGHAMPIHQVCIRQVDHHVISVSKDKNIRIWSLLDYSCKQSIHGRNVQLGRLDVTAMFYSEASMQLILGTNRIGVLLGNAANLTQVNKTRSDPISHSKSVTKVLYNTLFKMLVTSCEDSMICVWDIRTGAKTMQFSTDRGIEISAMTFDPSKRRLITGSREGKVSIWNFNNGARLCDFKTSAVAEVSDIIHARNKIISAGWDKNVTMYEDTYTDGRIKRMKPVHRDDILSMDYHVSENILATSSYDGEIVIWTIDLESVICRIDMHRSVFPIYEDTTNQVAERTSKKSNVTTSYESKFDPSRFVFVPDNLPWIGKHTRADGRSTNMGRNSIIDDVLSGNHATNKIVFLQSRRTTNNVAVLVSATQGYVLSWSLHQAGGLLAYYYAAKRESDTVADMDTDKDNKILVVGDSRGYLRIWDIRYYCCGEDVASRRRRLAADMCDPEARHEQIYSFVPNSEPPGLLASFRAHCKAITSITYINGCDLIASGSTDCSVRLWTVNGRYIGTFGQRDHWRFQIPVDERSLPPAIPIDVRRVASPATLFAVKGGYHHHWKNVQNAVAFIGRFRRIAKCFQLDKPAEEQTEVQRRFSQVSEDVLEDAKSDKKPGARSGSVTVWMEDRPHSIDKAVKKEDSVETMWDDIQHNGITSKVLGKVNYKPRKRHKTPTIDSQVNWIDKTAIIYSTLPCADLEEPVKLAIPEFYLDKLASQSPGALSRYGNRLIERKKVVNSFSPKRFQSGQNVRRNSRSDR